MSAIDDQAKAEDAVLGLLQQQAPSATVTRDLVVCLMFVGAVWGRYNTSPCGHVCLFLGTASSWSKGLKASYGPVAL